jgi:hypothetical protein
MKMKELKRQIVSIFEEYSELRKRYAELTRGKGE